MLDKHLLSWKAFTQNLWCGGTGEHVVTRNYRQPKQVRKTESVRASQKVDFNLKILEECNETRSPAPDIH